MKFVTLTFGIAGTVIALGLTGIAVAAPTENAVAVTQWDISHENLVREFSQGLGADIAGANPVLVAKAESAASGSTADRRARDRDDYDSERRHDQRTKKTKHFR
jgi:hypothetical protein